MMPPNESPVIENKKKHDRPAICPVPHFWIRHENPIIRSVLTMAIGGALLSCAQAWAEQNSPPSGIAQTTHVCGEKTKMTNMTPAQQIQQLPPATTPEEMLQLLRKLHDNFLLLDPSLIEDENLIRLFGFGEAQQKWPYGKNDDTIWKYFIPDVSGSLSGIRVRMDFTRKSHENGEFVAGGISFESQTSSSSSYTADLIEKHLVPDVKGVDRFAPGFPMTNENIEASARRPRATHPKGYLEYKQIHETRLCRSILYARLRLDGTLRDIQVNQNLKQWEQTK